MSRDVYRAPTALLIETYPQGHIQHTNRDIPYTEHNFTQYRDIYRDMPTYNNQLLQCRDIPAHSAEIQRSIQRIKVHRDIEKHTTELYRGGRGERGELK